EHPIEVEHTREGARGHPGRGESRAFLVRPAHELEWTLRAQAPIVEGPQDLEPREHPHDAVVLAAGELRVEMAAHEHGRQVIFGPGAAREDVAAGVPRPRAAGLRAPGDEGVAHPLVRGGEAEPAEAARLAGPDLARAHDGAPEPAGVDAETRV